MSLNLQSTWRASAAIILLSLLAACGGGSSDSPRAPLPETSTGPAGQAANASVDTFVQAELKRQNIPGVALLVRRNGVLVYSKGYGYADLDLATPATTEQRFEIGSISKQFTAAAVMLLVEEGRINLDANIGTYLGFVPAAWDAITVRHLLSHTSGLRRDYDGSLDPNSHGAYSTDQTLAIIKGYAPLTPPGAAYAYSNVGYQLAGVIVEKVSGAHYGELIQNRIFTPLGMTSARIIAGNNLAGNAMGYFMRDGSLTPLRKDQMSAGELSLHRGAFGGIEMSATDLAKWDASQDTNAILRQSSLDQMWTANTTVQVGADYTVNYGLGWFLSDYRSHPKRYHSGGMYSFTTDYLHYTDDKLTVIVLTNLGTDWSDPERISRTVANLYVPGIVAPQ
ncbi:MAG: serine hydrolase domain-containing protein [Pseudomonadota bacterium]